jgi:hypothetical protein
MIGATAIRMFLDLLERDAGVHRGADVHQIGRRRRVDGRQGGDPRGKKRVGVELTARERLRGHRGERVKNGPLG